MIEVAELIQIIWMIVIIAIIGLIEIIEITGLIGIWNHLKLFGIEEVSSSEVEICALARYSSQLQLSPQLR